MARAIDKWALTAGPLFSLFLLCAFVACKKRDEPAPAASVSSTEQAVAAASAAVAEAVAAASAAQAAAAAASATAGAAAPVASVAPSAPVLGEVKRFRDKEKAASGSTKVSIEQSKIYDEPDATTPSVASLPKDLVVTRLATLGTDWVLVEFPSGVGKVSPGWIEAKSLVAPLSVASTKPATSASAAALASAKPATTAVASTVPAPSASVPKVRPKPGAMRAPGR
ncbi:MAG: hypothetical protein WDO74_37960 [Pseudomonadota bacterium]